jgi:hypothetical protein
LIRRFVGAVATAFVLCSAVAATPANAAALPIGACTATQGAILAVDFAPWGGPVLRSCGTADGRTDTGFELLNEGGWSTQGDHHDGPAFVCRIGFTGFHGGTMYPTPAQDPCVVTPPATAYWSYWHAEQGQNTWSYSHLGAQLDHPEPGSVDLWTYGGTNVAGTAGVPTIAPDALRAHTTPPPANPPTNVPPRAADPAPKPAPGHSATTTTAIVPTTTAPTSAAASSSAAANTTDTPTVTDPPSVQNAQPRAVQPTSAGSPLPLIIGGVLVLAIAVGTGLLVRRRRRQQ